VSALRRAAASDCGSPGRAVKPFTPSMTCSASPPAVVATTGAAPAAKASSGIRPNGSARDGMTTAASAGCSSRLRCRGSFRLRRVASSRAVVILPARCSWYAVGEAVSVTAAMIACGAMVPLALRTPRAVPHVRGYRGDLAA
jgi:hypothetical protein